MGELTSGPATLGIPVLKQCVQQNGSPVAMVDWVFVQVVKPAASPIYQISVGEGGRAMAWRDAHTSGSLSFSWGDVPLSIEAGKTYAAIWAPGEQELDVALVEEALAQKANRFVPEKSDVKAQRLRVPHNLSGAHIVAPTEQNWCFSKDSPGTITIECRAEAPKGQKLSKTQIDQMRWTIGRFGTGTEVRWDPSWPGDPATGKGDKPKVTITGLPKEQGIFGRRDIVLAIPESKIKEMKAIRIFFPRDAMNNPDGAFPNWFYYWNQIDGIGYEKAFMQDAPAIEEIIGERLRDDLAAGAAAMLWWKQLSKKNAKMLRQLKDKLWIRPNMLDLQPLKQYGAGPTYTGIDFFAMMIKHESRHIRQMKRCDEYLKGKMDGVMYSKDMPASANGWSWGLKLPELHGDWTGRQWNELFEAGWNHCVIKTTPLGGKMSTKDIVILDENSYPYPDEIAGDLAHGDTWAKLNVIEQDACEHAKWIEEGQFKKLDWSAPGKQWPDGKAVP